MTATLSKTKSLSNSTFLDNLRLPVHRWFRFSAGFSAGWARNLIEEEKNNFENIRLLDPFAGVGTSVLAGEEAAISAFGLEAHPFIKKVADTKLLWYTDVTTFTSFADRVLQNSKFHHNKITQYPTLIEKCYSEEIIEDLNALKHSYEIENNGSTASKLTWLALAAILRICSPVGTAPWQYVLPNKTKSNPVPPITAFVNQVTKMASDMAFRQCQGIQPSGKVFLGDARHCSQIQKGSINLVITSPPYANNYDYADATRLEMTFFNEVNKWGDLHKGIRDNLIRSCSQHVSIEKLDLIKTLNILKHTSIYDEIIGICAQLEKERLNHGGKKAYHLMIAAYFADMYEVWKSLREVCSKDAKVYFVIGDSAPYGIYVPVHNWLAKLANDVGFEFIYFEKTRDRNIKWKNRKHSVPLLEGILLMKG